MKRSFVVLAALIVVTVTACGGERDADSPVPPSSGSQPSEDVPGNGAIEVGARMPSYSASTLDGRPFELSREKVVLLNIWATWCGPCRVEIPELQVLHEKYAAKGFEVLGVSVDDPGSDQVVRDFVREQKMTYPVVLDPQGQIADLFQTTVIPTSALIDREGRILWVHRGLVRAGDPALTAALEKAF